VPLVASVLFFTPIIRDFVSWCGVRQVGLNLLTLSTCLVAALQVNGLHFCRKVLTTASNVKCMLCCLCIRKKLSETDMSHALLGRGNSAVGSPYSRIHAQMLLLAGLPENFH